MKKNEVKDFPNFEIKANEEGTFEGFLATYDNVDYGGDVIRKGAFTKTIQENDGNINLLWRHNVDLPLGTLELQDKDEGLWVKGKLLIDSDPPIQKAQDAYTFLKSKIVLGLSIGFKTVKAKMVDGARNLLEISLKEGSLVMFPMNPLAQVASIKELEEKDAVDFNTAFEHLQVMSQRQQMYWALGDALDSIVWDWELGPDEKIPLVDETISQFHAAYLEFLPRLFAALGEKQEDDSAGQPLSAKAKAALQKEVDRLQDWIGIKAVATPDDEAGDTSEGTAEAVPTSIAGAGDTFDAAKVVEKALTGIRDVTQEIVASHETK
jgi:HK97 family phage prohead protease